MKRLFHAVMLLIAGTLANACSGSSTQEQTLVAENDAMRTEIANIRTTATVEADRMMITLEYVETQVQRTQGQQQDLISTMVARGTPTAAIVPPVPQAGGTFAVPTSIPSAPGTTQEVIGAATGIPVTLIASGPTQAPSLSNIVLSEAVGDNDCALNTQTQFSTTTAQIYVVATASSVPAGTLITSRWQRGADEVANFDFTPDFDIEQACIWFFIDQTDIAFTAGQWSVALAINSAPVGAAVPFTIVEATS
jgi:hypothetical protein